MVGKEESALAQCFMAIAGFVRKMNGTDTEVDTDIMNRRVAKMVEEALRYNAPESVLEDGEPEDIFSPEYYEKLSDVKMPAFVKYKALPVEAEVSIMPLMNKSTLGLANQAVTTINLKGSLKISTRL